MATVGVKGLIFAEGGARREHVTTSLSWRTSYPENLIRSV